MTTTNQALAGIKVIEYGELVCAPYCAKLLADLGAEVIKIEEPGIGDVARRRPPFLNDRPDPECSGLFLLVNTSKLGITLNMRSAGGRKIFKELISSADIFIHDKQPQEVRKLGLSFNKLKAVNPALIVTAVTTFGQTGPYKDYKAYPLNSFQSGGEGYLTPGESTYQDRPPLNLGKYVVEYDTAIAAAGATLVAYYWRLTSGLGQQIDISKQETMIFKSVIDLTRYVSSGFLVTRFTRGYRSGGMVPCKDGWMEFTPQTAVDWFEMFKLIGRPELADDETLHNRKVREERAAEIKDILDPWLMAHTKEEIYNLCQSRNISIAPVNRIDEVVNSEQLRERQFFVEIEHPKAGTFKYPSAPYRFTATPWRVKGPAPLLGQHNEEIYCGHLGYSKEDLVRLREANII